MPTWINVPGSGSTTGNADATGVAMKGINSAVANLQKSFKQYSAARTAQADAIEAEQSANAIDSAMVFANKVADKTQSVGEANKVFVDQLLKRNIGAAEANAAAANYRAGMKGKQELWLEQEDTAIEEFRAQYDDTDFADSNKTAALTKDFKEQFGVSADEDKLRTLIQNKQKQIRIKKEQDRADRVRAETFTPGQAREHAAVTSAINSQLQSGRVPLEQNLADAKDKAKQYDFVPDELIDQVRNTPGGIAEYMAEQTGHNKTWFGDGSDFSKLAKELQSKGFNENDSYRLLLQAYRQNPEAHNVGTSIDLAGWLGIDDEVMEADLNAAKIRFNQARIANSAVKTAANELNEYNIKAASDLAKVSNIASKKILDDEAIDITEVFRSIRPVSQSPSKPKADSAGSNTKKQKTTLSIADLKKPLSPVKPEEPKTPSPNEPSAASFTDNKDSKALQATQQEHLAVAKQIQALREKRDKISAPKFKKEISKLHEQSKVIRKKIKNLTKKVPRKTQGEVLVENIKKFLATTPDPSKNKSTVNKKELNTVIKQLQSEIN